VEEGCQSVRANGLGLQVMTVFKPNKKSVEDGFALSNQHVPFLCDTVQRYLFSNSAALVI